jgi:hypothetical protein
MVVKTLSRLAGTSSVKIATMTNQMYKKLGTGVEKFFSSQTKWVLIWMAVVAGGQSSYALSIQSPKGGELFNGSQVMAAPSVKQVQIQWDYPLNRQTPDLVFKVYHTTSFSQSLQQWSLLTNLPGTARTASFAADKPQEFFTVMASNSLGEFSVDAIPPKTVRLEWNYPIQLQTPDLVFNIYHSSHLKRSSSQWALLTNVPGDIRSVTVLADKSQDFYVLTASNYLGESKFATR